MINSARSSKPL